MIGTILIGRDRYRMKKEEQMKYRGGQSSRSPNRMSESVCVTTLPTAMWPRVRICHIMIQGRITHIIVEMD